MSTITNSAASRRTVRPAILLALAAWAGAEDLARWHDGRGTVGADAAKPGSAITADQSFAAAADSLGDVDLLTAPGSTVKLGAGAAASLAVESDAKGSHLVISLTRGAIEVHIADKGGYADVHVRGGAADVRVTGTLFVVERVRRDADYVALVNGHLKVGLRKEVADALGKSSEVDLDGRQGVAADGSKGLGTVETLSTRPVLRVGEERSVHDLATATDGDGPGTTGDGGLGDAANNAIGDQVFNDVDRVLLQQVMDNLISQPALGGPPRPPR